MPTYYPSKDNFLYAAAGYPNYGGVVWLYVGSFGPSRTILHFDLSGIPAGAIVTSATLRMQLFQDITSTASDDYRVYRLLQEWDEGDGGGAGSDYDDSTWENRKTGVAWSADGGFHSDDCEQVDIGYVTIPDDQGIDEWIEWTLTPSKVEEWISGTLTNNGMLIKSDNEANSAFGFDSRSGTDSPELVLELTLPESKVTQVGVYAETEQILLKASQAFAYIETESQQLYTSQALAYIETEQEILKTSQAFAYIEVELPLPAGGYGPKIQVI